MTILKLRSRFLIHKACIFTVTALMTALFSPLPASAQSFSLSVSPTVVNILVKPGKTITHTYEIENLGDPTTVSVAPVPLVPLDEKGHVSLLDCNRSNVPACSAVSWFSTPISSAFIKRNASAKFAIKIQVPRDAVEGDYYLGLVFSSQPPRGLQDSGSGISGNIVSNTLITVSESGNTPLRGKIVALTPHKGISLQFGSFMTTLIDSFDDIPVRLTVANVGTTAMQTAGTLRLEAPFLPSSRYPLTPQTILSGSQRLLTTGEEKALSAGFSLHLPRSFYLGLNTVNADVTVSSTVGREDGGTLQAEFTFLAIPMKLAISISIITIIGLLFFRRRGERKVATILTLIIFMGVVLSKPAIAAEVSASNTISIEAEVAELPPARFTLTGWTSPEAQVTISNDTFLRVVQSDLQGAFFLPETILPEGSKELCISSRNREKRETNQLCIPPPPRIDPVTPIGPILLPPTLWIAVANNQSYTLGESIPDSDVLIKFTLVDSRQRTMSIVGTAYATYLFDLTIKTDKNGKYSINLPGPQTGQYRIIASTAKNELRSPPTQAITFGTPVKSSTTLSWPMIVVALGVFFFLTLVVMMRFKRKLQRFLT